MGNQATAIEPGTATRLGKVVSGVIHEIGKDFSARHFSEEMFDGAMDPLLMVDHFVMTGPTFAPHMHAGISAVTALFEDSRGAFLNRDSLGHDLALEAGDLYWLAAAAGAVHEEKPAEGARIHALQIFVNLPARLKKEPARTLHVAADSVPLIEGPQYRVRLVLGSSGGVDGARGTPQDMTLLDGALAPGARFGHLLPEGRQAWVYAVGGSLVLHSGGESLTLAAGQASTVAAGAATEIVLESPDAAHFVLLAAAPIREPFVKHGPLVMSTAAEVRQALAAHAAGKFGRIPN